MGRLLITNAIVVTMDDEQRVIPEGDIFVEDGTIKYVGEKGQYSYPENVRVIEGKGKVALPGLINAHTHAAMTLFRGYADDLALQEWLETKIWPREAHLKPDDVYWGTLLATAEMIRGGTTTFADMYYYADEVAHAVVDSGIRASLCGVLLGILPTAAEDLKKAINFVEKWHDSKDSRITTMFGPHALYTCQPEHLKEVAKEARRLGVGIHIHLLETKNERDEILKLGGQEPFTILRESGLLDLPILAAHAVYLNQDEVELVRGLPFRPVHNPGSNMKLASGIAPIPDYLEAGISVAIGTDGAASNNNLDMFEEIRLTALLHKVNTTNPTVISAYQALEMATRGGALALGLENEIGQLREGMRADIILVDVKRSHLTPLYDVVAHLVYSARACDVTTTIVDGEILMDDGKLITLDEQLVMREATKQAENLMSR
ncbi:MAG: amidohydrolase family protein [Actinomycetota bacterium]